ADVVPAARVCTPGVVLRVPEQAAGSGCSDSPASSRGPVQRRTPPLGARESLLLPFRDRRRAPVEGSLVDARAHPHRDPAAVVAGSLRSLSLSKPPQRNGSNHLSPSNRSNPASWVASLSPWEI